MERDGFLPDVVTYVSILKACGAIGALKIGLRVHGDIIRKGLLEADLVIGSALLDMYAKLGCLAMARNVFDMLPIQNVVAFTALMTGYTRHGFGEDAIKLFDQMADKGIFPDATTVVSLLKACINIGATDKIEEIHAEMERKGFLESDMTLANALIDTYSKCGSLLKAQSLFDVLPFRDVVSWNSLIAGYAGHGLGEEALKWLQKMQLEGLTPDAVTYATALKAHGMIGDMNKTEEVLAAIENEGVLKGDIYVGSIFVNLYAKCGLLAEAWEVLNTSSVQDSSLWNALMSECVLIGCNDYALNLYKRMYLQAILPSSVTFVCSLRACGNTGAVKDGQQLHARILQVADMGRDLTVWNTMIKMYANFGWLSVAELVLKRLPNRDVVSWTNLISGYIEHNDSGEAFRCLEHMQIEGVSPDAVTVACCLKTCCDTLALFNGQELHCEIVRQGSFIGDLVVGNTLVYMYGICGHLTLAIEVFEGLPDHDVISWNGFLSVYAQQRYTNNAFSIFERMKACGIGPDDSTFLILLNLCSQSCLFHQSQTYFEAISKQLSMPPTYRHYACMIDCLCHCGSLTKALNMIEKVGVHYCPPVWRSVLNACRFWGTTDIAEETFNRTWLLDNRDPSMYVLLCQIKQENQI
ncbi:hypothetical protein KP509_35G063700 [Ceratopteris richardii]|nr:hypothetical protein KP509_35G063700 [Ceratopteris richardii]